ncbi:MAG TPA: glycosyltransferase family 4 protein [Solirubrobacteraceae bacterium]|nr:glycosyltransferase family 4 protein [Solirubrobacteraceae bacterium]
MKSTRRLRLLAYTDSPEVGGAELALGYLLGALAEEIDVGVLATNADVAAAIAAARDCVSVTTIRNPDGASDGAALREHLSAIRTFAPDILHANQAWPFACSYGELAGLMARGTRVLAVDHLPLGVSVPRVRRMGRQLLARTLGAHVAVGDRCARMVEEIVGLPHDSVIAVPNGVPLCSSDSGAARRVEHGGHGASAGEGPVVGSLGRLTQQKGYDLLVRALPALTGARLVLVGDGPERAALERMARELEVADRLTITGWVTDAPSHLSELDVFALPSRWEGMPLGILEAMHAGLPVVVTDVGSVAEVVSDGDTGYVVRSEDLAALQDRLRRLLDAPALRARMGERGQALARERYTDTAMARRYEDVYERMLSGWRPASPGSSKAAR